MENKKIRNKIITISGEPVSGKGTAVKKMIEKLKEQGFTDEQIHLKSTGHEFRRYFNSVIEFVLNLNDSENLEKISSREELKDFFENNTYRQLLAKTIVELKDSGADLSQFTIEQANNSELFHDIRNVVDELIDNRMKRLGEEINSEEHPNDIWIIDSRMASFFIKDVIAVRLTANPQVAGERLFNDKSRGAEDNQYSSIEEAIKEREARKIGEKERFIKKYDKNLEDENNYDLIIDTSYSTPEDIADTILECTELYYKNRPFGKKWASPKLFLPLQKETETYAPAPLGGISLEDLTEDIKENGYYADSTIEIIEVDGKKYIIEGHHRNFAVARAGKTLIPYETIAKDDEFVLGTKNTARQRAKGITPGKIYGHEDMIGNDFRYNNIYPGIYEEVQELQGESR